MEDNRNIDFWGLPGNDWLDCEEIEELVERYVTDHEYACYSLINGYSNFFKDEITIYGYVKKDIEEKTKGQLVDWLLEEIIEHMDEEYTVKERNQQIADIPEVRFAARKLVGAIINNGYKVEVLHKVCEKKIKISDYIKEDCKDDREKKEGNKAE